MICHVSPDVTGEELTQMAKNIEERLKTELFARTTIGIGTVSEHLREGQEVRVKVIGIDENGRINLSVKKAAEPPRRAPAEGTAERRQEKSEPSFEDKLKRFMHESDSRMSDARRYTEKKSTRKGNRRNDYD